MTLTFIKVIVEVFFLCLGASAIPVGSPTMRVEGTKSVKSESEKAIAVKLEK